MSGDGELVERARRFDERSPRALWPHTWKDAALREVARLRTEVERLAPGAAVLASVLQALEDPSRPEESPVHAVRRLRDEVVDDADARLCESADEIARLRERATAAESPERATAIIAAWLKLLGPMRERDGFAYTIGENLTAPEVRGGLGDDGWRFLAGGTVDVGDLDLDAIHGPTGASPSEPMTGPEFIEAIEAAHARGDFTPDGLKRLRAGVRRARGETPGDEQP